MKKHTILWITVVVVLSLSACGDSSPTATQAPAIQSEIAAPAAIETAKPEETVSATETEAPAKASQSAELVIIDGNVITVLDDGSGTADTENGIEKIPVFTNRNIGYVDEVGPIKFSVKSMQISKLTVTDESVASMLGVEKGIESVLIAIDITVENTSDDDISFYPYSSTIITNTKEQIESNWLFSDSVGGDFFGNVEKSGQIYWIGKSSADEITHIQWRIDSPHDSNYNHVGNDMKIEIEIVK